MHWVWRLRNFWTNTEGRPESALSLDHTLDNILVYWLNASTAVSARLYPENFNTFRLGKIALPVGATIFPKGGTSRLSINLSYFSLRKQTQRGNSGLLDLSASPINAAAIICKVVQA
ncbi:MAG: hypothetical protein GYB33_06500 [Gammaproteobacteria bacterium]|nr:hypothetical protein [Gammaproteobacteria bacterium]